MSRRTPPPLRAGDLLAPEFPLARYRAPQVTGVLPGLLETTTRPGDLVLELGTMGATSLRESLVAGRRMLALNVNPLPLLWSQVALQPPEPEALRAALTRLGDQLKGERPLIAHVGELYRSRCPRCQAEGTALWFAWDRDTQRPFSKRVRCPRCETPQEGSVDADDLARLEALTPRGGPAYHIALGRAAESDDPLRQRAAELVQLYTPRNLGLLIDVIHRLPRAAPDAPLQRALTLLVLEALDRGSSLVPWGDEPGRPRSLLPAPRYLEHNVWELMETALADFPFEAQGPALAPAASLQKLLASETGYLLLARPLREAATAIPPHTVAALIFQPALPDASFWALSALWSRWLWKAEDLPRALHAFLGRRRLDWAWYRRSVTAALRRCRPLLRRHAPLVVLLPDDALAPLAHTVAAAADAGFWCRRWIACPPRGTRLVFEVPAQKRRRPPASPGPDRLVTLLRRRGEPTPPALLEAAHAIRQGAEAHTTLAQRIDLDSAPFTPAGDAVWLAEPAGVAKPLADRVEEATLRLLLQQPTWQRATLETELYQRFPGERSPEPALIAACIAAYTNPAGEGAVALREEDQSQARRTETLQIRGMIRRLGQRLAFEVARGEHGALFWRDDDGAARYRFYCTTTAQLGRYLLESPPTTEARCCLVLPGGRAALVALKLRRDPRLQAQVEQAGWVFIKYRHLRRMAAELNQRSSIEVYLGLDPIVEQESAQIPLPLD